MAGFVQVSVRPTKPHEINADVVRQEAGSLSAEDEAALAGLSASALITAVRP